MRKSLIKPLIIALFLICFALPANYSCMVQEIFTDDWPMFKYSIERTGADNDYSFDSIKALWKYQLEEFEQGGGTRVSPAASDGKVVVPTRHHILCLDVDDGKLLWKKYIGINYSSPVIYNGRVIISSINKIFSLKLSDGSIIWVKDLTKETERATAGSSVPLVYDNMVYYGFSGKNDNEGYFLCLDFLDGSTIWRYRTYGPVQTSPLIIGDTVLFGSDDSIFYCLDSRLGTVVWTYVTSSILRSTPASNGDAVFFGSNNGFMYCLDSNNGQLKWRYKTDDKITAAPSIAKDRVIFSSSDKHLYCLSTTNGKQLWQQDTENALYTSPTICEEKVIFGFNNIIKCISSNSGSFNWTYELDDSGAGIPLAIYDNKLFFRTTNYVYCFALE